MRGPNLPVSSRGFPSVFFFSSRRRHTRSKRDWSSDVCSSDLRLRKRGYSRRPESLFRILRKLGLFPAAEKKKTYRPKPYEQMTYPGQRVQVDVKVRSEERRVGKEGRRGSWRKGGTRNRQRGGG